MQRCKVGALGAMLLLLASGCALEAGEPDSSPHVSNPGSVTADADDGAHLVEGKAAETKVIKGSPSEPGTPGSPLDPVNGSAINAGPGKPQPDPWAPGSGSDDDGSKPQPDPWAPGTKGNSGLSAP